MKVVEHAPRGDMYLPVWVLVMGCVMCAAACWFLPGILQGNPAMLIPVLGFGGMGVGAVLCWKNQRVRIISDTHFEYTTFLGNTYTYAFRDISRMEQGNDHWTLYVADGKVHMESCARVSRKFCDRIDRELKKCD